MNRSLLSIRKDWIIKNKLNLNNKKILNNLNSAKFGWV